MKTYWLLGVVIAFSIVLSIVAICMHVSETAITDLSLVIGFIGILATFIVVNNAFQIWKMERKLEKYDDVLAENKEILKNIATATQRNIYTFVRQAMQKNPQAVGEAFLYYIDVFQIMPYLYGKDAGECSADGDNIRDYILYLEELLQSDNRLTIAVEDLQSCKIYIKRLPCAYHNKLFKVEQLVDDLIIEISHERSKK